MGARLGARDTGLFPHRQKGRKEEQDGVDQLEETGDFRGTERTKLSQGGSPCRLNPFQLIPDRRELTVATTIVSSGTSPRINANRLSNNSKAVTILRGYFKTLSKSDCERKCKKFLEYKLQLRERALSLFDIVLRINIIL